MPDTNSQDVSMITCTAPVNIAVIKYCECALCFCGSTVRERVALQKLCWSFLMFCPQGVNGMKSWFCPLTPHWVSLCIRTRWENQPVHFIKGALCDIYKQKQTYTSDFFFLIFLSQCTLMSRIASYAVNEPVYFALSFFLFVFPSPYKYSERGNLCLIIHHLASHVVSFDHLLKAV